MSSQDDAVLAAATTLAQWAHDRRRLWTEEPLARTNLQQREVQVHQVPGVPEVAAVPEVTAVFDVPAAREVPAIFEVATTLDVAELRAAGDVVEAVDSIEFFEIVDSASSIESIEHVSIESIESIERVENIESIESVESIDTVQSFYAIESVETVESLESDAIDRGVGEYVVESGGFRSLLQAEEVPASARVNWGGVRDRAFQTLRVCGAWTFNASLKAGAMAMDALDGAGSLSDAALWCLTRGAALVSIASVVTLVVLHRSDLFSRWGRLTETVAAAAAATRPAPVPVVTLPPGDGRLLVTSSTDRPQVIIDGKAWGPAPVTVILPAGVHRLLLRGPKGSVERTVRVEAGETADVNEEIFPGWVAVSAAVDLTLTENGRTLKRDERGWAILTPGPHDIHLDNELLGIHETRHVVVTPGDATRVSLAPVSSTLSVTTNEPAEVWVDGTSVGEAPIVDAPMKLGVHDVRVRSAGHERWLRVRVTVQPTQLNVDLTAE